MVSTLWVTQPSELLAASDIATDGSTGPAQQIPEDRPGRYVVDESIGRKSGRNLFHSFDRFGVDSGDRVVFKGSSPIDNVISRVTGGAESQIDGLLRSKISGANFWLLNPNGVVFGNGARLDVGGQFNVSTADSILFADGVSFPANLNSPVTFTAAPPVDFGFLSDNSSRIRLSGAELENPGGFLIVGGRIQLRDGAVVSASDENGSNIGSITIEADQLTLRNDSELSTFHISNAAGGALSIAARDVELDDSQIFTRSEGSGAAGGIEIGATRDLEILNGSSIASESSGGGETGRIGLSAKRVDLTDAAVSTEALGSGSALGINIDTRELRLRKDSMVEITAAETSIDVGDIAVGQVGGSQAPELVLIRGGSRLGTQSAMSGGGNIFVNGGERIEIVRGEITTDVGGGIGGGNIDVRADEILIQRGTLSASAADAAGGRLTVQADQIQTSDDTQLTATGGLEVDGEVVTNPLDATLESQMAPLPVDYLDAPALLEPTCSSRDPSQPGSRFEVARRSTGSGVPESLLELEGAGSSDLPAEAAALVALRGRLRDAGDLAGEERVLGALAHLYVAKGALGQARDAFVEAGELAGRRGAPFEQAKAYANAARAAVDGGEPKLAREALANAGRAASVLPPGRQRRVAWVHLGHTWRLLSQVDPSRREEDLMSAYAILRSANDEARKADDLALRSQATGEIGALYADERRTPEALLLTREALSLAEAASAPEAVYRWHWQEGRLYWELGKSEAAVQALRRAVAVLEDTRQDSLSSVYSAEVVFRKTVAPVYLDLVNALLMSSGRVNNAKHRQSLLREARGVVEGLKVAELRNYYRDECVADLREREVDLEQVSSSAAVIYPVVLPDRLEVLVSIGPSILRHVTPVTAEQLGERVRVLRAGLRGVTHSYRDSGLDLYRWLVEPFEGEFGEHGIETLVFVPDGPLRMVPMAALYDGKGFLAERYATAVTPGLEVVDPGTLDRSRIRSLGAGVSEARFGFKALPHVPQELAMVQRLFGGESLLNEDFSLARADAAIRDERPSLVHIASHGEFTGDVQTSFLLTWDGRLTMDSLSDVVGAGRFSDEPLELLVLSACKTAAGDERAALGLAGLAVRSGARSAVGSLWRIGDEATALFMESFYGALAEPGRSRAESLQRARQALLDSRDFSHPRYWSAFMLIGNWL